jgi:xanthine dehydrogenase accessory factor
MAQWQLPIAHWLDQPASLQLRVQASGQVSLGSAQHRVAWQLPAAPREAGLSQHWDLDYQPLPRVVLFGAGPEMPLLLPLLQQLGWKTLLVEARERWIAAGADADRHLDVGPTPASGDAEIIGADAALVMHHNFELDRETLQALADSRVPYIGLLGPKRRRDDLFKLLSAAERDSLGPRLRSPVGLDLGGQGAAAIALSIAAQLQELRHRDHDGS